MGTACIDNKSLADGESTDAVPMTEGQLVNHNLVMC